MKMRERSEKECKCACMKEKKAGPYTSVRRVTPLRSNVVNERNCEN